MRAPQGHQLGGVCAHAWVEPPSPGRGDGAHRAPVPVCVFAERVCQYDFAWVDAGQSNLQNVCLRWGGISSVNRASNEKTFVLFTARRHTLGQSHYTHLTSTSQLCSVASSRAALVDDASACAAAAGRVPSRRRGVVRPSPDPCLRSRCRRRSLSPSTSMRGRRKKRKEKEEGIAHHAKGQRSEGAGGFRLRGT